MYDFDIAIGSDHAGYELKEKIKEYLAKKHAKKRVQDFGTYGKESVDYPDFCKAVTDSLIEEVAPIGILICGTGVGMSIMANRNSDIRAALCINEMMAEQARSHNDANILVVGSKVVDNKKIPAIIDLFLETEFEGGRHQRRLDKIN